MALKLEVAHDLGIEQRDSISRNRVAEAGMELLRRGGAADDGAALERRDLQAGAGEIGCGRQSVVASAADDDVDLALGGAHWWNLTPCASGSVVE